MKWDLRKRFLIPTLLLFAISMGISSMISYMKSEDTLQDSIAMQITRMAESAVTVIDLSVESIKLNFAYWSEDATLATVVQDLLGETVMDAANNLLVKIKKDYTYYDQMMVANNEGKIIAGTAKSEIGNSVAEQNYFKKSLSGSIFVSDVTKSSITGNPVFVVSSPIRMNDEIVGVLFGSIDIRYFNERFIEPVKFGQSGYTYMFDKDGMVLAHPNKENILKLNIRNFYFGKQMMAKGKGLIDYTWQGVEKMVAFKKYRALGWTVGVSANKAEILAPVREVFYINIGVAAGVMLFVVTVVLLVIRSAVRPINRVIKGLTQAADQVASAASQILAASRQLARGSSDQAASSQETSSSLEEMSAMTRKNAQNANQADSFVKDVQNLFKKTDTFMAELTTSMEDISDAGMETSAIIKTIDEIAFQTNLLALNAAVEAARAGQAGAGFAVVANEVRTLALRAAQAAQNTSALIQGIIKKIQNGWEITAKTSEAFGQAAEQAEQMGELITEIAVSSNDQKRGIDLMGRAVTEMDKITQQNAANSQETSSASEQMKAQSERMKGFVDELAALVGTMKKPERTRKKKKA